VAENLLNVAVAMVDCSVSG